jgi:hypothetical protein
MTTTEFGLEDVERLGAILDQVELDENDRVLLHAIFARAGSTALEPEPEPEVSGFGLGPMASNPTLFNSFNLGVSSAGGGGGTGKSPTITGFHFSKTTDSASPNLFNAAD